MSVNQLRTEYPKSSSAYTIPAQNYSEALVIPSLSQNAVGASQNPSNLYQQMRELCSKRISTLDYLRKAHDGRVYWYNTLFYTRGDLSRMSLFEAKKLSRRATNFFLLGLSLPNILDLSSTSAHEYLRTLTALLSEFESFQHIHSADGVSATSLSKAKIPQMFKRATHTGAKGRRTSAAADIGLPMASGDSAETKMHFAALGSIASSNNSLTISEQDLMPGEDYTYLLTPALPFEPDFFETFATLCDVLIDCYSRVMILIPTVAVLTPGTSELFAKADAKVRKLLLANIVKEFEDTSRSGIKTELAGLSRVLTGGLV